MSPNRVRESQVGTHAPMPAHMCITGESLAAVTLNGMTLGLW